MTYVVYRRVTRMYGISSRVVPFVVLLLVHNRVASLEVDRPLELGVVFVVNKSLCDLLLDHSLAPVIVEPRLFHFFLRCGGFEKRVG